MLFFCKALFFISAYIFQSDISLMFSLCIAYVLSYIYFLCISDLGQKKKRHSIQTSEGFMTPGVVSA